jgi:hypothetical protein
MTIEHFQQFAGGVQSSLGAIAVIIGGIWTYQRFIRQRDDYPHIEFSVDINFVGEQDGFWLTELIARFENKGKVQHRISDFKFDLFALYAEDKIVSADEFGGQVFFPHKVIAGSWLPKKWEYTFIDPGVSTHYSFVASVPKEMTYVILHGWFQYPNGRESHSAEMTIPVPTQIV